MSGLRTGIWILMIMVPVSLMVRLLEWFGLLRGLSRYVGPLFKLWGLPAEASLSFLAGAALNCYSGIAAMTALDLTRRQITILSLMILVCHNLFVEGPIQKKAGSPLPVILFFRISGALLLGFVLNLILPADHRVHHVVHLTNPQSDTFWGMLGQWGLGMLRNGLTILVLIIALMIFQRLITAWGVTAWLARTCAPFLRVMGLPGSTAFLWIVANALGLAYGAGIILEEIHSGAMSPRDADLLNRSISVCHSLLEDSFIFAAVGASVIWITIPRVVLAALIVWVSRWLLHHLATTHSSRS